MGSLRLNVDRQYSVAPFMWWRILRKVSRLPKNLRRIRPGYGLSPKYYEEIIGKQAKMSLERGTALKKEMVRGWGSEDD